MQLLAFLLLGLTTFSILSPFYALAQELVDTTRTSETKLGVGQNGDISAPVVSPNGKYVALTLTATNLVSGDTNSYRDVFVKNLETGVIKRVNLGLNQAQANGDSFNVAISPSSPNGFVAVVFESEATNLHRTKNTFPDINSKRDIYFSLPRKNNLTERISVGVGGVDPDGDSFNPSVSIKAAPNRLLVTYASIATNLVSTDGNAKRDIFLATLTEPKADGSFDPVTEIQTVLVTNSSDGVSGANDHSYNPLISGDGRFIVFESVATNLVSGVSPTTRQIYLYNVATQEISLVSKALNGTPGDGISSRASISFSGSSIVYLTTSNNIVGDGYTLPANRVQVMLYDVVSGETQRINAALDGTPSNGTLSANLSATVGPSGRQVLFSDSGSNLVANDNNGVADVFLKDRATGVLIRLSEALGGGDADGASFYASFGQESYASDTGIASYGSAATNLIGADTEGQNDAFISTVTMPPIPLRPDTELELPAAVGITGDDSLAVTMQDFAGAELILAAPLSSSIETLGAVLGSPKIRYVVTSYREGLGGAKLDRIKNTIIKRNSIALNNLAAGTHVVRYRTQIVRKNKNTGLFKVFTSSQLSPVQRIIIGD
jgi:dipeptidyl aminopeptidase/acylaminoacyl peptidase